MKIILILLTIGISTCQQNLKVKEMKQLENFLSDIPRFKQATIVKREKFNMGDYKTFYVTPENQSVHNRAIFMVKGDEIFPTHKSDFFKLLMADMFTSGEIESWDTIRFSEVYFTLGLHSDAKILATPHKAKRYEENMGDLKWKAPERKVLKDGIQYQFYAVNLQTQQVKFYNLLVKKDGEVTVN